MPPGARLPFLSDAARGVALRVAVDEQDVAAGEGEGGGEVDRRGGLADATLLIGDGDNLGISVSYALN